MENVIGFLCVVWIAVTSIASVSYWCMRDLTPSKFEEAVTICGDRGLKHIDLGVNHHIVVCKDGGEYRLSMADKEEK